LFGARDCRWPQRDEDSEERDQRDSASRGIDATGSDERPHQGRQNARKSEPQNQPDCQNHSECQHQRESEGHQASRRGSSARAAALATVATNPAALPGSMAPEPISDSTTPVNKLRATYQTNQSANEPRAFATSANARRHSGDVDDAPTDLDVASAHESNVRPEPFNVPPVPPNGLRLTCAPILR